MAYCINPDCSQRKNPDNCAVCQDQLKKEQEARTINHCSHMFHRECIDRWFETNVQCPCCRYDIRGL